MISFTHSRFTKCKLTSFFFCYKDIRRKAFFTMTTLLMPLLDNVGFHSDFFGGGFFFMYKNLQFSTILLCYKKCVTEKRTKMNKGCNLLNPCVLTVLLSIPLINYLDQIQEGPGLGRRKSAPSKQPNHSFDNRKSSKDFLHSVHNFSANP